MLELRINARTSRQPVLGDIYTDIRQGDRICLLGPSGIGKTTLLNVIAGLEKQVPAEAVVKSPSLTVGYMFQEHRLLPWRSVRQNLALVGCEANEADRLLGRVGLAASGDKLPDELSLGMARRAALARCLAVRPDLLLLDEPFASLDPERAGELRQLICDLMDERPDMAMICVTHESRDADHLANRLWYLNGTPAQLQWDERLPDEGSVEAITRKLQALSETEAAWE